MMDPRQLDIWDVLGEEIPGDDFRESLRRGSGYEGGRVRIYAAIMTIPDRKKLIDFIRDEYGTGGHSFTYTDGNRGFIDYDPKGYRMKRWGHEEEEQKYSWLQVTEAILDIARKNKFLTKAENETIGRLLAESSAYNQPIPTPQPRMRYAR